MSRALVLVLINGHPIGRTLHLSIAPGTPSVHTIGRAHTCDLALGDEGILGVHALARRDVDGWAIDAAHPDAHVYVNAREVQARHVLAPDDKLTFGTTAILSVIDASEWRGERIAIDDFSRGDHDPMTRVLNKRAAARALRRVFADATARGGALSVALVHLDRTKHINDVHGSMATDQAIIAVARVLQHAARTNGVVGRYLGDGFVLALPDSSPESARLICESVREGIAQQRIDGFEAPLAFTVSIGVATHTPDEPNVTMRALVQDADRRLARAKAAGRDRVVST